MPPPPHELGDDAEIDALLLSVAAEERLAYATVPMLKKHPAAGELLRTDPAWSRRVLLAIRRMLWPEVREDVPRHGELSILEVATALFRRKLPLDDEDYALLLEAIPPGGWTEARACTGLKPGPLVKSLLKHVGDREPSAALESAMRSALERLLNDPSYSLETYTLKLEEALEGDDDEGELRRPIAPLPPRVPLGDDDMLPRLQQRFDLLVDASSAPSDEGRRRIGPDGFLIDADSRLERAHATITSALEDLCSGGRPEGDDAIEAFARELYASTAAAERADLVIAAFERVTAQAVDSEVQTDAGWPIWVRGAVERLADGLDSAATDLPRSFRALRLFYEAHRGWWGSISRFIGELEELATLSPLTPFERHAAGLWIQQTLLSGEDTGAPAGNLPALTRRLLDLLGDPGICLLVPVEPWVDRLHADLRACSDEAYPAWVDLVAHLLDARSAKPNRKWMNAALEHVEAVGVDAYRDAMAGWLEEAARPVPMNAVNSDVLRGLVFTLVPLARSDTPAQLADLLFSCLKKLPGEGQRGVKVANACLWALGEIAAGGDADLRDAALAQLARLSVRVTFKTAKKGIDKALDKAATAAGLTREEIIELGIPAFGFERGQAREEIAGCEATLEVSGSRVTLTWRNVKGRAVKAVPSAARQADPERVRALKQTAKDAAGILSAAAARYDAGYLDDRSWTWEAFRGRHLDHGLVGTVARRLIWEVAGEARLFDAEGAARDAEGREHPVPAEASVRLWHPIGASSAAVQAWRARIEQLGLVQPFKQAHREVYTLTPAEITTGTYSNRFAAHVLKQHQFQALCVARRWDSRLRMMVDDEYPPPTRPLPAHGLRAEYWVEGHGEDWDQHANESGAFHWLTTDQVRFYVADAPQVTAHASGGAYATARGLPAGEAAHQPLPLAEVPPLVLSEVLRDVDLFVGVSGVAGDPNWADGGPDGHFRDYWHQASFGELGQTAETRRTLLSALIPRLNIAERCRIEGRWLYVKGSLRTYKIHLGSTNILMEPNDAYLCIVPQARSVDAAGGEVYLPFEGDRALSVILSKAILLADDASIDDPTIVEQIRPARSE